MIYNSSELARLSGYPLSDISKTLRRMGYSPVGRGEYQRLEWQEECLEALLKKRNETQTNPATTILIGTLASLFHVSNQIVRDILNAHNIQPVSYKNGYVEIYPITAKDVLIKHFDDMKVDNADEHPLVTDRRWLKLNNWPNIIPQCFVDLDKETV